MNIKSKARLLGTNLLLISALFGLVTLNKEVLRPASVDSIIARTITGFFPNFIAAFLISLAIVNGVLFRNPKSGRFLVYLGSTFVFMILMIEEFKPMWGASTHFDPWDIVASGVGSILAILTFEIITSARKGSKKDQS
jgi:hypothetical protein